MSIIEDLETLNNAVGTKELNKLLTWFSNKYRVHLDFQLNQNKYVVVNYKGARIF